MKTTLLSYSAVLLTTIPILSIIFNGLSIAIGVGLTLSLVLLGLSQTDITPVYILRMKADALGFLMTSLIFLVSTVIHQFSKRYMAGDRNYRTYFYRLSLLTSSAAVMALADNVVLFFSAWCISNFLLISLMVHKKSWAAAAHSGKLAFKTLFGGAVLFFIAIILMYVDSRRLSISQITAHSRDSYTMLAALVLCIITAMTQSAIWPFHRWLISSLNSPTPISAFMHAGLVNGGGFLLVRFAPLLTEQTVLLNLLFIVGVLSAVLGTLWKLVQSDVKRMLACSTVSQMGFMMIQCGLGLFPAAIAHLIWHGLFKSFLFLNAGSAVQTRRIETQNRTRSLRHFLLACAYGLLGAYSFATVSDKSFLSMDTTAFLVGFAWIASTQVAHAILKQPITAFINLLAIASALLSGAIYGSSIHLVETAIPSFAMNHHSIHALHLAAFIAFIMIWVILNLEPLRRFQKTDFWKKSYVATLNGSQPNPNTITSIRPSYQY